MVCRRNFQLNNLEMSADFAALSVSLFPCIPIRFGIQQKLTIFTFIRKKTLISIERHYEKLLVQHLIR